MTPTVATILIVEEETEARLTLCRLLGDAGYKVIGLEKRSDALEMIQRSPFDVVIADITLPGVDAMEILELAKEVNPDTTVIIITSYASIARAVDTVSQGAYAYFVKPINPGEIKTVIANVLKQQWLLQENKRLVEGLQLTNKLLLEANEKLQIEMTERKQAEEALKESEEKYRSLVNHVKLGVFRSTPGSSGKFLEVNPAMEEITGYSREELLKMDVSKLYVHPEKRKTILEEVASTAGRTTKELHFRKRDGTEIVVSDTKVAVRDEGGKILYFDGIIEDITERKRMEEDLQEKNRYLMKQQQELMEKTKELEAASEAKSEFLAHMSHELRTPLNVIIGFSELMLDGVPGKINKEQRQCLDDILSSSKHLLDLINDVLDLSKVESGKIKLRQIDIAMTDVLEELKRTMTPILAPRKQSLDIEVEEGLPPVHADKGKVRQVLLNLLGNATKFTPDGGKLKIEAIRKDHSCQVSVVDNGIGIKKEDQEKLFEPFSQLDNPLIGEKGGTGLGLAVTKQIIEKHGGQIWVESEYGRGSRFTFTLPLAATG